MVTSYIAETLVPVSNIRWTGFPAILPLVVRFLGYVSASFTRDSWTLNWFDICNFLGFWFGFLGFLNRLLVCASFISCNKLGLVVAFSWLSSSDAVLSASNWFSSSWVEDFSGWQWGVGVTRPVSPSGNLHWIGWSWNCTSSIYNWLPV